MKVTNQLVFQHIIDKVILLFVYFTTGQGNGEEIEALASGE